MDIFRELDDYYHEEQQLEQKVQSIMRKHTMEQNDQYFRRGIKLAFPACGHPLIDQAPRLPIRPPSDVIQAACGLALLSDAPKASEGFVRGQPMNTTLFPKSDNSRTR